MHSPLSSLAVKKTTNQQVLLTVIEPKHFPKCYHHLLQCNQTIVTILGMDNGKELSCQQQQCIATFKVLITKNKEKISLDQVLFTLLPPELLLYSTDLPSI